MIKIGPQLMRLVHLVGIFAALAVKSSLSLPDSLVFGVFAPSVGQRSLNASEINQINDNCFGGVNLTPCRPNWTNQCVTFSGGQVNNYDGEGQYCSADAAALSELNYYGLELRMAQKKTPTDRSWVTCPVKRSACVYDDEDNVMECDIAGDTSYIVGITVSLTLHWYSENGTQWNGVSKCEISTLESTVVLEANQTVTFTSMVYGGYTAAPTAAAAASSSNNDLNVWIGLIILGTAFGGCCLYKLLSCWMWQRRFHENHLAFPPPRAAVKVVPTSAVIVPTVMDYVEVFSLEEGTEMSIFEGSNNRIGDGPIAQRVHSY